MRGRAQALSAALLYGSLWGLAEATAGHALHSLRVPGIAGFLMFPLGFFLMSSAYGRAKNLPSVLMTSWVAASVKLADLLIPGADAMAVLNPAQAILLQGLAVAWLLAASGRSAGGELPMERVGAKAAAATLGWRSAHAGLGLLWSALAGAPSILQAGGAAVLRFLVLDGLVNAVFICILMKAGASFLDKRRARIAPFRTHPAAALALLAAAVVVEIAL
jgi:hypothetical protein